MPHPPSARWNRAQTIAGPHSGLNVRVWAARRTAKHAWHRCEHGRQESTPSVRSGRGNCCTLRFHGHLITLTLQTRTYSPSHSLTGLPLGYLAILINNSQSQALEAEAGRGLESEMMCMSKGPQTFQSQALPGVILDLDPREGEGLRTANPSRSSPELAWMDVFVIVCFPSSWKQWQVCLLYSRACAHTSLLPGGYR